MTLRSHLLALVLVALVPVVVFSVVLLAAFARHERAAVERGARETVRALTAIVDQQLDGAVDALSTLAVSSRIERGDWRAFYDEARALKVLHEAWETVFVADTDGHAILNIRVPYGTPLPSTRDHDAFHRVLVTRRPVVSDVALGRSGGRHVAFVLVPVLGGAQVRYVLGAAIDVQRGLDTLLTRQRMPADWSVVVFDGRKTVVAHTERADALVGRPVGESLARASTAAAEGWYADANGQGARVYAAFSRSPVSRWTVAIGIPAAHVEGPLRRSLAALIGSGLAFLVLAGVLAVTVGRRIARAIGSLSPAAEALARGAALPPRSASSVGEVEALARDLDDTAAILAERAAERARIERERARLLARAEAARGQAEVANRAKDEFLATVSHELRTPLTSMLGWARMLRTRQPDAALLDRGLEVIDRNARHQAQLIEDLLDVSRIITGKLRLDIRATVLAPVVEAALDAVRGAAEGKGVALDVSLDPSLGAVRCDPDRLQQVVWNLVSNAIKFTPAGGRVAVSARAVDGDAELVVSDTGKGIEVEFLPFVFDRFRQSELGKASGGLGLGLALVRHLVELHGGTVHVSSAGPGQGATFTVRLPRAGRELPAAVEPARHAAAFPSLTGVRVLVVDDDPDARELLAMILEECDAEAVTAGSVPEALRRFDDKTPDVVVSDISMPERDGYALVRELRRRAAGGPRVPMIALTASARGEDRHRALAAGFDVHVAKPVEPAALADIVTELVDGVRRAREAGV